MGVPITIGGMSLKIRKTQAGINGATPTKSNPTATIGTIINPDNNEATVALRRPFPVKHSCGFAKRPGIKPVNPTPVKSNMGVAGLKYPPRRAQSVFPRAPAKKPVTGPNNTPKTHGRKAKILQWIAPGINGIGAVSKKPTPVIAEVTTIYAMLLIGSGLK